MEACPGSPGPPVQVGPQYHPGTLSYFLQTRHHSGASTTYLARKPVLQLDMPELVDGASLAEHTALVGVIEEGDQPWRDLAAQCQPPAGY